MAPQRSAAASWRRHAANAVPTTAMSAIQRIQEWMMRAVVYMDSVPSSVLEGRRRFGHPPLGALERGFRFADLRVLLFLYGLGLLALSVRLLLRRVFRLPTYF